MSHSDPEFLALAALGENTGTQDDAVHLAQCPDCQQEFERLTRLVDLARDGGPVFLEQPPASVWEQIAAATGPAENRGPARTAANGSGRAAAPARPAPARRPARRRRLGRAVAGVAAGLVIGIGGTVAAEQLTRAPASPVVAQVELRPLAQFPQWQHSAGTAVLRDTQAAQQLTVTISAPARNGFYEVWLLGRDGTSMISLGDLNADHAGTFTIPATVDLRFYSRVDISLQPFNGSPVHSASSVVRGSLPAAVTGSSGRE